MPCEIEERPMIEKMFVNKWMLKPLRLGAKLGGADIARVEPHSRFQLPEGLDKVGAYIHIPFCKNKCPCCPFRSFRYSPEKIGPYIEGVKKEISLYRDMLGDISIGELYFGGGTPSLAWRELIGVIEHMRANFRMEGGIGIEANPEDVTVEMCDALLSAGVDRVSMGIQTFDPQILASMGRDNYDKDSALRAITLLLDKGFHLSLDMMYGLPNQQIPSLVHDAETASKTGAHQVCYYLLALFYHTSWYKQVRKGTIKVAGRGEQKRMVEALYDPFLRNGYKLTYYGFEKRAQSHRQFATCQRLDPEIGIGLSSFARVIGGTGGLVYANTADSIAEYLRLVNEGHPSLATGIAFSFSPRMQRRIRFLIKRIYPMIGPFGLTIEDEDLQKRFGIRPEEVDGRKPGLGFKLATAPLRGIGLLQGNADEITLTQKGLYWFNYMHNITHATGGSRLLSLADEKKWLDVCKLSEFEASST